MPSVGALCGPAHGWPRAHRALASARGNMQARGMTGSGRGETLQRLPRGIWALGLTSLLMDASSELVHALLPIYLTAVLGLGMATLGLLEGLAEATSLVTKVFSGWLSDRLGRRKWLTVAGYALAALTKPAFPLAESAGPVFAARFVDRLGKGLRGAPRDAMVADLVSAEQRGAAYGLRQALDSVGAVLGPLAAVLLMLIFAGDLRTVLWFAVIPAVLAVAVLVFGVQEPARVAPASSASAPAATARPPIGLADLRRLPPRYWSAVALGAAFVVARFPEAFLIVRGHEVGLASAWVPILLVAMNVVYAASAYPAGAASDRFGTRGLLFAGLVVLAAAHACLASIDGVAGVMAGAAAWGLHLGLTQGLLARLVADAVPVDLRGSAFGVFGLVTGIATLAGGLLAGLLWDAAGARLTFAAGAVLAIVTAIGLACRGSVARRSGAA
jgi:MFS family permease